MVSGGEARKGNHGEALTEGAPNTTVAPISCAFSFKALSYIPWQLFCGERSHACEAPVLPREGGGGGVVRAAAHTKGEGPVHTDLRPREERLGLNSKLVTHSHEILQGGDNACGRKVRRRHPACQVRNATTLRPGASRRDHSC